MATTRKTAIVTGGSQGIGAGLVRAFLDRGYNVVANSRNIASRARSRRQINSRWSTEAPDKSLHPATEQALTHLKTLGQEP